MRFADTAGYQIPIPTYWQILNQIKSFSAELLDRSSAVRGRP